MRLPGTRYQEHGWEQVRKLLGHCSLQAFARVHPALLLEPDSATSLSLYVDAVARALHAARGRGAAAGNSYGDTVAELALALDRFLRKAAGKEKLSAAERRVAAKSRASGAVAVPESEVNILDVPTFSFGLAGVYAAPETDDETIPEEDDDVFASPDDERETEQGDGGSLVLSDMPAEDDQWLP